MANQSDKKDGLKIVREFNAPVTMVFEAFSSAEAFAQWWGPVGMPVTVKSMDFRKDGKLHYKMEGHGQVMWGMFRYINIEEPHLIEFVNSFSDEAGNLCKAPFPIEFPMEILNKMTLVEKNGITTLTIQGYPINPTDEQAATYFSMFENMSQGFNGTFDQLENYLKMKSEK